MLVEDKHGAMPRGVRMNLMSVRLPLALLLAASLLVEAGSRGAGQVHPQPLDMEGDWPVRGVGLPAWTSNMPQTLIPKP